ncbi:helix-turn-helix domain-containing protein [Wenzhouxiangella sediminis]|uniref:DNA-binding protein n=1 Tax=Wenzhouxiangella sediminis TaxID=1792836 RepID=A0A3E1K5I6_9GAMM|nr:helix-turn-helix domain-containing protein [Wenzhouxiangella sediminis]RFF29218.1 DNA-binding protein [Wenzhouxiangella sediminis]
MHAIEQQQSDNSAFLLTIEEAISSTRTSRATLYREINSGRLKTVKIGRRRYVTPEAIREWVAGLSDGEAA